MPSKQNPYASLPFVGPRKGPLKNQRPRDFWCDVHSTGDTLQDEELGARLARLALQAMKAENFSPLLGWIVLDMIRHKCPDQIAIGFFHTIAGVCLGNEIPATDTDLRQLLANYGARAKTKPNANLRLVK
jgi:hypothetical protein